MANRRTRISFPIFNDYEVRVVCSHNLAATGRRLGEKDSLVNAEAGFIVRPEQPGVGWLVFGRNPMPDTVAHEAFHAVKALFKYAGAAPEEESFAYHLDFLVGRIHRFLKRG